MNDSITFGGFVPDTGEEMKIVTISLPQNVEDGLRHMYRICCSFVDIQEKYDLFIPYKELNTINAEDEYEINKVIKLFEFESVYPSSYRIKAVRTTVSSAIRKRSRPGQSLSGLKMLKKYSIHSLPH